jgi:hypothetical protein
MKMKYFLIRGAVGCLAGVSLLTTAQAWTIPSPATTEHPSIEQAPASDPRTYPDDAGFEQRRTLVIDGLAPIDLARWRTGWFKGGDPGKYLPLSAMAKLVRNADDAAARQYMNDDRSYKEFYHFAVVNWARFMPIFGDALTAETKTRFAGVHGPQNHYFDQGGTENHKVMWLCAANVLPSYIEGNKFSGLSTDAALKRAKEDLRSYVRDLYAAGQGEWDSSTYLMFDLHGMLNIYDFAKDPETRLIAKAALDWYTAGYALKYRDGVYTAPNQRGFAPKPVESISDQTGWLWWGSNATITTNETRGFLYAMHPATSGWRPNRVLCHIARKELTGLPVEQRNTKPNYYYGIGSKPIPGQHLETVYIAPKFTIGTMWNGHGSQLTRFQIAVESDKGAVTFTGGNPRKSDHTGAKVGIGLDYGTGRYTQFAAMGPTGMSLSRCPEDDAEAAYSYVTVPEGIEPKAVKGWQTMTMGATTVAIYPIGGTAELTQTETDKRGQSTRYLKIAGNQTGFVAHVGALADLDVIKVEGTTVTGTDGRKLEMTFVPASGGDAHGNQLASVKIGGQAVDTTNWPIYSGPFVKLEKGVLTVSDGKDGYTVNFSGELPVYGPIQ